MTWEEKEKMATALNSGEPDETIKLLSEAEDWDDQAVDIFVNSFSILESDKLLPIKERFINFDSSNLGLRGQIRYDLIKLELENATEGS